MTFRLVRWKALIPLGLVLALLCAGWLLLLDRLVEKGVEETGARLVGAKVDLASADVRLRAGALTLRGLEVANPDAPMTNLVEAEEIVADVMVVPLLERSVVVETLAVRGVRFGTTRQTSGALENPPAESGRLWREVRQWADRVTIPTFSLEGLGGVVNVGAIAADSLESLAVARTTVALADSMRASWRASLAALNPQPQLDSARALMATLQQAQPLRLGLAGVTNLVQSARSTVSAVERLRDDMTALDGTVRTGVDVLHDRVDGLAAARLADYAYARSLLRLPSLEAPDISPALFGDAALSWVQPVLYWVRMMEQHLPPGLDPQRRTGPDRVRRPGVTVEYPGRESWPRFLLRHAEVDLELGGTGVEAGRYVARVRDLTTTPALWGAPATIVAQRSGARRGPRSLRLGAMLDHARRPIRDSVHAVISGITLPTVEVGQIGARLVMGQGDTDFALRRAGDSLSARWFWRAGSVTWERSDAQTLGRSGAQGVAGARVADLVWRAVSALDQVEIEVRLGGRVTAPAIGVRSNVGEAIARNLRRELGREIEAAERQVRAEVDRLVGERVEQARTQVTALQTGVQQQVATRLEEIRTVEDELRRELERFLGRLPPGLRRP